MAEEPRRLVRFVFRLSDCWGLSVVELSAFGLSTLVVVYHEVGLAVLATLCI